MSEERDRKAPGPADLPAEERAEADELRHAESLRDALAAGRDSTSALLLAAMQPAELDEDVHERLLARALGGSATGTSPAESPAAPAEQRAAEELRDALADARSDHPLAQVARALKHAHAPGEIAELRHEGLLRPALRQSSKAARRFGTVLGFGAALAVAASVLGLYLTNADRGGPPASQAQAPSTPASEFLPGMVEVRSTRDLFGQEDFPRTGGASERMDRISRARASDLRQNRYTRWGVP